MGNKASVIALTASLCFLSIASTHAQNASSAQNTTRIEKIAQTIEVSADGKSTTTTHTELKIMGPDRAAASQISISYDAILQTAEIVEAFTRKTDGRKISVQVESILTQKSPSPPLSPIYTDREQKIIIFPNVESGDELIFTSKLSDKQPYLPNQFTASRFLTTGALADDVSYSIAVPRTMKLNIDSAGMLAETRASQDKNTYIWSIPKAPSVPEASSPHGRSSELHFVASTFNSYEELSHYLAPRLLGAAVVTSEIQNKAAEITKGVTGKRDQAQALYNWINTHIRYVAIELGAGSITPHDASWTLTNSFGDCKDQAILLIALLKARNIDADPVLIDATPRYHLSVVPTVSQFNHVIVWIPELKQYADSTVPQIAFGQLPLMDYGKPVVHVSASGPALFHTPIVQPGSIRSTYSVHAVPNSAGGFDVDVTMAASGFWASNLKVIASEIQVAGESTAAERVLRLRGFSKAEGTLQPAPDDGSDSFAIVGAFSTGKDEGYANLFGLADALRLIPRVGDGPLGPIDGNLRQAEESPCYSAQQTEEINVQIPNGFHLEGLPPDLLVTTSTFSYQGKSEVKNNSVILRRDFLSKVDQPSCSDTMANADALSRIDNSYVAHVRVVPDAPKQP